MSGGEQPPPLPDPNNHQYRSGPNSPYEEKLKEFATKAKKTDNINNSSNGGGDHQDGQSGSNRQELSSSSSPPQKVQQKDDDQYGPNSAYEQKLKSFAVEQRQRQKRNNHKNEQRQHNHVQQQYGPNSAYELKLKAFAATTTAKHQADNSTTTDTCVDDNSGRGDDLQAIKSKVGISLSGGGGVSAGAAVINSLGEIVTTTTATSSTHSSTLPSPRSALSSEPALGPYERLIAGESAQPRPSTTNIATTSPRRTLSAGGGNPRLTSSSTTTEFIQQLRGSLDNGGQQFPVSTTIPSEPTEPVPEQYRLREKDQYRRQRNNQRRSGGDNQEGGGVGGGYASSSGEFSSLSNHSSIETLAVPGAQHVHERPFGSIPAWARPRRPLNRLDSDESLGRSSDRSIGRRSGESSSSDHLRRSRELYQTHIPPELRTSFERYGGGDDDLDQSNLRPPLLTAETVLRAATATDDDDNDDVEEVSNKDGLAVYDGVNVDTMKKKERRMTFICLMSCFFVIGIMAGIAAVVVNNENNANTGTSASRLDDDFVVVEDVNANTNNTNAQPQQQGDDAGSSGVDAGNNGVDDVNDIDPAVTTQHALMLADKLSHLSSYNGINLTDMVHDYKYYYATSSKPSFPIPPQVKALYWLATDTSITVGGNMSALSGINGGGGVFKHDHTQQIENEFQIRLETEYALVVFYYFTNGQSWTYNTNYPESPSSITNDQKQHQHQHVNVCDWYNVTCDDNGRQVTELWYENNNLFGPLPNELFLSPISSSLTKLSLPSNGITGTIPSTIGLLTKLAYLNLSYNSLKGTIPTSSITNLSESSSLETIILCSNILQLRTGGDDDNHNNAINLLCSSSNDKNLEIMIDCDYGDNLNFINNCGCCKCCQ